MNRIEKKFSDLKANHQTALIPFITAGYPDKKSTLPLLHCLAENGAHIIEIGVPFSDPVADGPTIQASSFEAIKNGVNSKAVLDIVAEFRKTNQHTPIVLMGYANPIEAFGWEEYAQQASAVGVDGLLTVDLQPEPDDKWGALCQDNGLNRIILIAPTTSKERQTYLSQYASGYIYYVALKGITGSNALQPIQVKEAIIKLKSKVELPVVVGFGIKDAKTAAELSQCADGIVVGSQLLHILSQHIDNPNEGIKQAGDFISELNRAIQT
jgi:tryptophan synthase alpha chain